MVAGIDERREGHILRRVQLAEKRPWIVAELRAQAKRIIDLVGFAAGDQLLDAGDGVAVFVEVTEGCHEGIAQARFGSSPGS